MQKTVTMFVGAVLLLGVALPVAAGVDLDLSYVDTGSEAYARFAAWVDEAVAGSPGYGFSATDAAYMFRITGAQAYGDLAVAMAEQQVSEAEAAIAVGQRPDVAFDSYLYAGPMIRDVAVVYDWCAASLSASQRTRFAAYAEQTVWNIWNPEDASWGGVPFPWSGWSTDNPGNNYHYSFLEATMYWALASGDQGWLDFLSQDKLPTLVTYFQGMAGGGSREGTGYGLSHRHLFELYRLWFDATGQDLAAASPHLDDSIDYFVHATVPTGDRFAPIGDQARVSEPVLYDYHRALVLEARAMASSSSGRDRASWWLHRISLDRMQSGFNLRDDLLPAGEDQEAPTELFHHATGAGHLFARSSWQPDALWLSFVAGPYVESHAHQDQGSFTLYRNGWLAVTENIWTHSGIQQGGEVHNLVRFSSGSVTIPQEVDTASTMSVSETPTGIHVDADLSPAFAGHPAVGSWQRSVDFGATGVEIHDSFTVAAGVAAVWQLNTPVEPVVDGLVATAGSLRVTVLLPADATLTVLDWTTVDPTEFLGGYRLDVSGGGTELLVRVEDTGLFADGFESGSLDRWSASAP